MDENKTVRAVFLELFDLTMARSGSAGSLTPSVGTHTNQYLDGDVVTLTAGDTSNWLFAHWSGDVSGQTTPYDLTMNDDKSVTGHFVTIAKVQYDDGTGYEDAPSVLYVRKGKSVTFRAIPNPSDDTWPSKTSPSGTGHRACPVRGRPRP